MEMEVENVMEKVGKIGSIVPPRLEDAGLENCALSVQGIREAFMRAADAVQSQASSIFDGDEDGGGCIEGAGPCNGEWGDSLLDDPHSPHGSQGCLGSRVGGLLEESKDKVVSVGDEGLEDKVMDVHIFQPHLGEEGESCVAGLEGLPIPPVRQDGDEDDEDGFPVLTETYV